MQFSYINNDIQPVVKEANKKFSQLMIDLGVAEYNNHILSKLGGNNFQLLVLMGMKHKLVFDDNISIDVGNSKNITWSATYLAYTPLNRIRKDLDQKFGSIVESYKYEALAMQALAKSKNLRSTLEEYKDQFPQLMRCLDSKTYAFDPKLSNVEKLILANIMCEDLAADLDKGNRSRIQTIGSALNDFPPEIVLLSIRKNIGLMRIIEHNLDDDPIFLKTLDKVQKLVWDK